MVAYDSGPQLELDWEEGLFKAVHGLVRRWRASRAPALPHRVALEPLARRLEVLASMLAGRPLTVAPSNGACGLRGDTALLPSSIDALETVEANAELYVLSAVALGTWARARPEAPQDPKARARASWLGFADALDVARADLPGFEARWSRAARAVLAARPAPEALPRRERPAEQHLQSFLRSRPPSGEAPGVPPPPCPLAGVLFESPDDAASSAGDAAPPKGAERAAPRKIEDVRRAELEEDREKHNPIVHTFEKVETLDSHEGGARLADGSDELDDQLEALEEVDLSEVVRGGPPAQALLRAEVGLDADIPDVEQIQPGERGVRYDEWDVRKKAYRKGWATVYPTPVRAARPGWARETLAPHQRQVRRLVERLSVHKDALADERRQLDGEHIDLDAAIDAAADRARGHCGAGRVYVRRSRRARDVAAAVLLDVSLSSDAWVADQRVLDVSRRATLVLGEVADRLGDPLAVYAFASKTRNACRVFELGGFETPWATTRDRLGALEPQGYTRMGPAIRHVTAELADQPAKHRLLLVISDGKPTDYDRYEGAYGVADIRKSLGEASLRGVVAHALAIDATARASLAATFGPGAWHVLTDPHQLPRALTEAYGRLSAR